MTDEEILVPLKIEKNISSTARDDYLLLVIKSARDFIKEEGVEIDDSSISDGMLIEMYASYLYDQRKEKKPMPRSLRWALNNRLFSQKGQVDNGDS